MCILPACHLKPLTMDYVLPWFCFSFTSLLPMLKPTHRSLGQKPMVSLGQRRGMTAPMVPSHKQSEPSAVSLDASPRKPVGYELFSRVRGSQTSN